MTFNWLLLAWLVASSTTQPSSTPTSPTTPTAPQEPAGASRAEQGELATRLNAIDDAVAKTADLRADFEQHRYTQLLKKPLISRGVVRCKGELVRWDTTTPRPSSLLIGRTSIRVYYPDDKLVEIYTVGKGFKDLAGAPLPRLSALRTRFEIQRTALKLLGVNDDAAKMLALELTPKSEDLRKHIVSVRVLIDEARSVVTKLVMTDPDGEVTEVRFSNIAINAGPKDLDLELTLPDDVRTSRPLGPDPPDKGADGDAKDRDRL